MARDSIVADDNKETTPKLPIVDKNSETKKANVDYMYYSDQEEVPIVSTFKTLNRSQSLNEILTPADRTAIKNYTRWNQSNLQAKQIAVRLLSKLAQSNKIKPGVTAFKLTNLK